MSLTPVEFRALVTARGYSLAELGRIWGLTKGRMSQIASDEHRAPHFDLALWGTPVKANGIAAQGRRRRVIAGLATPAPRVDEIELGEVFMVANSPGEHLPEGALGIVQHVGGPRHQRVAHLVFTDWGYEESFEIAYLLAPMSFLIRTGRVVTELQGLTQANS